MPTLSESSSSNASSSDVEEGEDQPNSKLAPLPGLKGIDSNRNDGTRELHLVNSRDLEGSTTGRLHETR